jgi:hypothetical protein
MINFLKIVQNFIRKFPKIIIKLISQIKNFEIQKFWQIIEIIKKYAKKHSLSLITVNHLHILEYRKFQQTVVVNVSFGSN